jgi:hypothetical protein
VWRKTLIACINVISQNLLEEANKTNEDLIRIIGLRGENRNPSLINTSRGAKTFNRNVPLHIDKCRYQRHYNFERLS